MTCRPARKLTGRHGTTRWSTATRAARPAAACCLAACSCDPWVAAIAAGCCGACASAGRSAMGVRAARSTLRATCTAAATAVPLGELVTRCRVAIVAIELNTVERHHEDFATAHVDGARVLVDVGDREREMRHVTIFFEH